MSVSVTILSQPPMAVSVSLYTPAVEIVCPAKLVLCPAQIVCDNGVVKTAATLRVNATMLSQPLTAVSVSRYTPAVEIVCPLNVMLCPEQMFCEILVVRAGVTVTVSVMMLSQPPAEVSVSL